MVVCACKPTHTWRMFPRFLLDQAIHLNLGRSFVGSDECSDATPCILKTPVFAWQPCLCVSSPVGLRAHEGLLTRFSFVRSSKSCSWRAQTVAMAPTPGIALLGVHVGWPTIVRSRYDTHTDIHAHTHTHTHTHIYIYIYAAGCLIEPPFSTLISRNLRKRSAKMSFCHPKPCPEKCTRRGFN